HENENFCPKMIGFSANTNVRFIYDFCEDEELKATSEQKFNNTKLFRLLPKSIKKYTKIFCDLIINTLTVNDSRLGEERKIVEIDSKFKKDVS
ncbi:16443_t:CDS:2, partial [Racocetra persica]